MAYGAPWCRDGISIRHLQLQAPPHYALDAWGREKEQPVLLSVHLAFKSGFDSAAKNDALDASTMHYGILAKSLRGLVPQEGWGSVDNLGQLVHDKISSMLPGPDLLDSLAIEITMPKASLLGESVVFHRYHNHDITQNTLHLVNACLPTLIGVNSNERKAKQKLVVNLWIGGLQGNDCDSYTELEQILTQIVEPTDYETLESLALHVLKELTKAYAPLQSDGTSVRLSLAKPQAVPFAEAPAIEVFRTSEQLRAAARS